MLQQLKTRIAVLAIFGVALGIARELAAAEAGDSTMADWEILCPDTTCQIKTEGESKVTITVPDTNHDLNPRRKMKAPRLLKTVTGDFIAQVKVTSDFTPSDTSTGQGKPFNGAGLIVWENEDNFLRLERNAFSVSGSLYCYPPLIEHWRDGKYAGVNARATLAGEFFKGRSTWLKLQRQGERMTASYSHDGDEWTVAKEFKVDFPEDVSVGIQALNTSNAAFTVEFEHFEIRGQTSAPDEDANDDDEDLAADLALMQGTWELDPENKLNGLVANRDLKIVEGNQETVQRFDRATGELKHEHSIEFRLSKSGNVRVFTFYAVGDSPENGASYVYKVDKKSFVEASGLLQGEDYRNYRARPRAWYWKRVSKHASDQPGSHTTQSAQP